VEIPKDGAEGILVAHGALFGGYALYMKDRKLHYVHNYVGRAEYKVSSAMDVHEGAATLRFEFEKKTEPDFSAGKGAGGVGQLYINGKLAGEVEIPTTTPGQYAVAGEGLTCGYDAAKA